MEYVQHKDGISVVGFRRGGDSGSILHISTQTPLIPLFRKRIFLRFWSPRWVFVGFYFLQKSSTKAPMEAKSSTPQNPSDQNHSQPTNSQNPYPKMDANQNPDSETPVSQNPENSNQPTNPDEKGQINNEERENTEEEEEEEEGECGFCLFMKGGGCKDAFIAWEQCVDEGEKNKEDIVEKCFEVTTNLKLCMEAHSDYYEPILRAEKAAEEEVKQEMEREADRNSVIKTVEESPEIEVQKED
ncbi:uncharacterized protein LOC130821754 [Amaranthus tricolor]|uniref:uncharacterized protein LOC130821754 n=1 Tax=Amaranthus tricolor TaxID=29722 RepID=UPI0025827DA0|nr:uncharacterized protein LOC130821754 [Amaranthus tricolor]